VDDLKPRLLRLRGRGARLVSVVENRPSLHGVQNVELLARPDDSTQDGTWLTSQQFSVCSLR
jgi:hypothetical protein